MGASELPGGQPANRGDGAGAGVAAAADLRERARGRPPLAPVAAVATLAGLAGTVAAAFLPWVLSGSAVRDSFATVRSARLLELGDSAVVSVMLAGWYAVPAVAAASVLALVLGRRRLAAAGAVLVGGAALALAGGVLASPLAHGAGPLVALATGILAVAGGIGLAATAGRGRRAGG